jgi:hypothetical protein
MQMDTLIFLQNCKDSKNGREIKSKIIESLDLQTIQKKSQICRNLAFNQIPIY